MKLYLFDFDGTITPKDSMVEFIKHIISFPRVVASIFLTSPRWALMAIGLCSRGDVKSVFLRHVFKNLDFDDLQFSADRFARAFIKTIYPSALKKINDAKKDSRVCIVTASLDIWMQPIADLLGVELICTRSKFKNNRFEGISGRNCNGIEKVRRIREKFEVNDFDRVIAFGNSHGDAAMLELSDTRHYRYFQ
jgi:phosphatidylglycerophosphatase C